MKPDENQIRQLPIYRHEQEIIDAVRDNPVIVVEGPTGCGKTTQLPKILLQSGVIQSRIGMTQPRRIAAVSVAWRIAEELDVELGREVGYAIRFDDTSSEDTIVKLMTDGILLEEARTDSLFHDYGAIVVDEAHERSLNIDLTLALLHRAVGIRDDLRVIVSSATIEPERFQDFFAKAGRTSGRVPLVSIKARRHPIDIQYRPPAQRGFRGRIDAIADEVVRIHKHEEPGGILVFLTGQAMIHKTMDGIMARNPGKNIVLLPLYGRLTRDEQERVFDDFSPQRKVVLATNIAETSITIPDVRYVVDCGFAKIPRYDPRTGIMTLREEPISMASTEQRAGRAGRTGPGIAVRMYDQKWLKERPKFTEEEILRHDLAEIVLRIIDLGVSDVESFPLPTPPPQNKLRDALETLRQLGAIDHHQKLTSIGRKMVPFPLTPRLARMVVEASTNYPDVMEEILIVGAFMSARSPFLFPEGEEMEARKAHDKLADPWGDAMTAVKTFRQWRKAKDRERYCQRMYLDPDTMDFFGKAFDQMEDIAKSMALPIGSGGEPEDVSKCICVGFPNRIVARVGRHFETLEGAKLGIHPSSSLFGTRPRFAVATDFFRTRRTYASQISLVEARWLADVSPEAARLWLRKRDRRKEKAAKPRIPDHLQIAGQTLPVRHRGKSVVVDIEIEQVEALKGVDLNDLPKESSEWRARVRHGRDRYLTSLNLPGALAILDIVPLPGPDEAPLDKDAVPQGALLDRERNLHTIERFLDLLLQPIRPLRGKKPGWLMLVANGAQGFWYEVSHSFVEAVDMTAEAVHALYQNYHEDDPAKAELKPKLDEIWKLQNAMQKGLAKARRFSE